VKILIFGALVSCSIFSACAHVPGPVDVAVESEDARVMWIGAHPDDETLAAPLLARACIGLKKPCYFFVFNHGDGGRCPLKLGCNPTLAATRGRELKKVADAYGAELEHHFFYNAPLPEESFPPRASIAKIWKKKADPGELVANAIRKFRPTMILTFDPERGFTGHPEHQLASRFAMEGLQRAADSTAEGLEGEPWRVPVMYHVLNHFWITRIAGSSDPAEPTEEFNTHQSCGAPRKTCLDVALEITKFHVTQVRDMGLVRQLRPQIGQLYLRKIDPLTEPVPSPYE
jgi:LmbE family N-acetylglucosaminyl deacetylase